MARSVLPDALARREWLEQPLDAARALGVAEAYLAEERAPEAVVSKERARAAEHAARLAKLRAQLEALE